MTPNPPTASRAAATAADSSTPAPRAREIGGSPEALAVWLAGRRWWSGSDGPPASVSVSSIDLGTDPELAVAVVATPDGARHQLLTDHGERADVADDPTAAATLAHWVAADGRTGATTPGEVRGHWLRGATALGDQAARPLGGEQSNTSVVVGGTHVLKLFRRLQDGIHPEIEIGRHLALTADPERPAPVAPLAGWYELGTDDGDDCALGVVQDLVPGALDAWGLVLSGLAGDAAGLLPQLHRLGADLATLHGALARPAAAAGVTPDPGAPEAFGAVALTPARIEALVQGVSEDATRILATTVDRPPALTAVVGRAAEVAERAEELAASLGKDLGAAIRHHGDLHLGQVVLGATGWVILDFEGEPSRELADRRQRHSPLRDVAGMLRSFAYAAATHRRAHGHRLPPGWEPAARAAFLDGYLATVDPALLPSSASTTVTLLTLLELEKVVYEVAYEVAHRPDWVDLPVSGLVALLPSVPSVTGPR